MYELYIWVYTTSLTPQLFIDVSAPSHEKSRRLLGLLILPLSAIFLPLDFGTVLPVWYDWFHVSSVPMLFNVA